MPVFSATYHSLRSGAGATDGGQMTDPSSAIDDDTRVAVSVVHAGVAHAQYLPTTVEREPGL
jgi:hypothetical protein